MATGNQSQTGNGRGDERLAAGVAQANIPTLLMVLVQLTGDRRWLRDPYRPRRARGMGDNDTARLPEDVQTEIREAAAKAIAAWRDGQPPALPEPDDDLLVEMLSCAMGEPVPPEYGPMIAAELRRSPALSIEPIDVPEGFDVLIIGGGMSGLCAGVYLDALGVPFTIVERNETVGGTWWENRYPGAGVDTPNHLYSYSFFSADWSMYFALQNDLHGYLEATADEFGLRDRIELSTSVDRLAYDPSTQRWTVTTTDADGRSRERTAAFVISAAGIFNPPVTPRIEGLDSFAGPTFHTAQWPDDVSVTGRRVAVIGTGASSMQVCPEIQHDVEALAIFQRSPQWAAPFEQFRRVVPDEVRYLLSEVPLYRLWYRIRLGWTWNDRNHVALQKDPNWEHPERSLNAINDGHRQFFTEYIHEELGDRQDLIPEVVPPYPPFGKRILMDNGWFRMLRNPAVELVSDPVDHVEPDAVVTRDGRSFPADVLVLATGFDVLRFATTYEAIGRSGQSLQDRWGDDGRAYLGLVAPDFPNFFTLYGPNTQPGHGGSLIFVIESQMQYLVSLFTQMVEAGLGAVECKPGVHDAYNERVDEAHENMVWTHPGMETYYRNAQGRVVVNFPFRNVDLFHQTRRADLSDFHVEPSVT